MELRAIPRRRWVGSLAVIGALAMLVVGLTLLAGRMGPLGFVTYWMLCFALVCVALLMALFDKDRAMKLKRVVAEEFADMDVLMTAFNGPDGSTLITERNKAALAVLAKEIAAGKKKIAIFYGGGHMPDMEPRAIQDFHLKREGQQWLEAWNLRDKK